jgi:hypothetical protein
MTALLRREGCASGLVGSASDGSGGVFGFSFMIGTSLAENY